MAEKSPSLTTPRARLCFPALFEPQVDKENPSAEPLYNCVLLFDPKTFTQKDIAMMAALKKAGLDAIRDKFGPEVVKSEDPIKLKGDIRWPIMDAVEKEGDWAGFVEGRSYLRVKSKFRPGIGRVVLGDDGKPKVTETEDREIFYPGAFVRAKVSPWAYKNKTQGLRYTLENILFLADGERLVQAQTVENRFDVAEIEDFDDHLSEDADGDDAIA